MLYINAKKNLKASFSINQFWDSFVLFREGGQQWGITLQGGPPRFWLTWGPAKQVWFLRKLKWLGLYDSQSEMGYIILCLLEPSFGWWVGDLVLKNAAPCPFISLHRLETCGVGGWDGNVPQHSIPLPLPICTAGMCLHFRQYSCSISG